MNNNTLLIGQVLQLRDKLFAKRHSIPPSLRQEWHGIVEKTASFDSSRTLHKTVNGQAITKPTVFNGNATDLVKLVSVLKDFELKIAKRSFTH